MIDVRLHGLSRTEVVQLFPSSVPQPYGQLAFETSYTLDRQELCRLSLGILQRIFERE